MRKQSHVSLFSREATMEHRLLAKSFASWKRRWLACASLLVILAGTIAMVALLVPEPSMRHDADKRLVWGMITAQSSIRASAWSQTKELRPFYQGTLTLSTHVNEDGQVEYWETAAVPCDDGYLTFTVMPSKTGICGNQTCAYDIGAFGYTFADIDQRYSMELCNRIEIFSGGDGDRPPWNDDEPTVRILHEGDYMTKLRSCRFRGSERAPRCGTYYIMQRGEFYSDDFMDALRAYVNSWPADGSDDNDKHEADVRGQVAHDRRLGSKKSSLSARR
jgi:hypothetical protein